MNSANDQSIFFCPNLTCPDYGQTNRRNIIFYRRYGKKQTRLLQCETCGKTFCELHDTPFWDSRLDWKTIENIYRVLIHGDNDGQLLGIRASARLLGLSKNTIKRYLRLALCSAESEALIRFMIEHRIIRDTAADRHLIWQRLKRFHIPINR